MFFSITGFDYFYISPYPSIHENKMILEAPRYINQLIKDHKKYQKPLTIEPASLFHCIHTILNNESFKRDSRAYLQQWEKERKITDEGQEKEKWVFNFFKQNYKF